MGHGRIIKIMFLNLIKFSWIQNKMLKGIPKLYWSEIVPKSISIGIPLPN